MYINCIQFKLKLPFDEYCRTVLVPEEADEVLGEFELDDDSDAEELPSGAEAAAEDTASDEEEPAPPARTDERRAFEAPAGYEVLDKPVTFLAGAEALKNLFVIMLWAGHSVEYARNAHILTRG
ncbi:hypothetical protein CYMTET_21990 [Cymbomonas tetramitiformis]|uniref:Uncharacterized protein n=2 Tax=Cymbomonas tetramitiformis TaxID=36881 RepID=A0AAE0G142_9CHLO|nr:hypothetical protein CYMTET_21990 [Cymbomonas tetramitiformis]